MSGLQKRYCAFGCDALVTQRVSFHRFPHPKLHADTFAAWVSAVGDKLKEIDHMHIYKYKKLCDLHFESKYKHNKCLIRSAVPTVNLNCIQQSLITFIEADHNYTISSREYYRLFASRHTQPASASPPGTHLTAEKTPVPTLSKKLQAEHPPEEHGYSKRRHHEDHNYSKASSSKKFEFEFTDDACNGSRVPIAPSENSLLDRLRRQSTEAVNDDDLNNEIDLSSIDDYEEPVVPVFSWQKKEFLQTDDTDVKMCPMVKKNDELKQQPDDFSLYDEDLPSEKCDQQDPNSDKHAEYLCNVCESEIVGFRYTCVQCADWDLCGACEARAAHGAHYMLRVPRARPYSEIQTVIAAIRQQLLSENLFLSEQMPVCVKTEPEDEATEPDPLWPPAPDGELIPSLEHSSPRRKRRRNSSDSDDASEILTKREAHGLAPSKKVPDDRRRKPTLPIDTSVDPIEIDIEPNEFYPRISRHRAHLTENNHRHSNYAHITVHKGDIHTDDPIFTGVKNTEFNVKDYDNDNKQVLHLRVPPDTNDAALAQALRSQTHVVMQPLAFVKCMKLFRTTPRLDE